MGVRDFLERLRPSGTPGAPSVAGVPADRLAERSTELEAVFALLEDVQAAGGPDPARLPSEEARRRREVAHERADAHRRRGAAPGRGRAGRGRRVGAGRRGRAGACDRAGAQARAPSHRRRGAIPPVPPWWPRSVEQARAELLGVPAGSP